MKGTDDFVRRRPWAALLIPLLAVLFAAEGRAQMPDLSRGRELWHGRIRGVECRLVQIPRQAMVLVPLRLCLEAQGPEPAVLLSELKEVEVRAAAGSKAEYACAPRRVPFYQWGTSILECRLDFRMAGAYVARLPLGESGEMALEMPIEVAPVRYLPFGEEFLLFGTGVLGLGVFLWLLWMRLRRHERVGWPLSSPGGGPG